MKSSNNIKYALVDFNEYFDKPVINKTPLELITLGELNLPTGNIVACDPLGGLYDSIAFTRTVAPGRYPVIACIAKTEQSEDRYALVKLEFNKEKATKWEMALLPGENVSELEEDDCYGFGVDAGLGCFCDVATQEKYNEYDSEFMTKYPNDDIYSRELAPAFKKNAIDQNDEDDIGDWLNFKLPNQPDQNVIMFRSGLGDGTYPCYWGTTDEGKISSLVIDFQIVYYL